MIFSSMTRISTIADGRFAVESLPRGQWATGDYVVAEVAEEDPVGSVETATGRLIDVAEGDRIVGALGSRYATIEATGSWEDIRDDGQLNLLSGGGLLGRLRSVSTLISRPVSLRYRGHVHVAGGKATMQGCLTGAPDPSRFRTPVILVIGTSMSAGKTTAAKVVIRRLKEQNHRVVGAKVAGAGRYRDILAMQDAGADAVFDFVDAGLPSTHCSLEAFGPALDRLLGQMAEVDADVAVVEAGASPLEPYNGAHAIERLRGRVVFTLLCASDPYAVVGALEAYGLRPDLVTGPTANTEAGVDLVQRLTDLPVLDVRKRSALPAIDTMLRRALEG
jgi:hypothetical protein